MHTQQIDGAGLASKRELLRGLLITVIIAAVVLVTTILPAEYGVDPTGIGKMLGIKNLSGSATSAGSSAKTPAAPSIASVTSVQKAIASKQSVPYRADTREIVLQPSQGLEVKTLMTQGATLIYSWKTKNGEKISHDFHGEKTNAKSDEFESYIEEKSVSESKGSVIAPFTGTHGWFWNNQTANPVTVILQASGFYTDMVNK